MKKTILISGVNGVIGSELAKFLLDLEHQVYGIDIHEKTDLNLKSYESIDITDKENTVSFLTENKIDFIIHCAAIAHKGDDYKEEKIFKVNFEGTKNLIDGALSNDNLTQFIFLSTTSVYNPVGESSPIRENQKPDPVSFYGESKLMAEEYCQKMFKIKQFPVNIIRLAPVYTEKAYKDLILRINPFQKGPFLFKFGSGKQTNSFCSIKNLLKVIEAFLKANPNIEGEIFNLADDRVYETKELLEILKKDGEVVLSVPRLIPKIGFELLGRLKGNQKKIFKSYYWKLCEQNLISNKKIKEYLDISLPHNIFDDFSN